ncbi:transcription repressor NadR [Carboxydichorda subterranea]|uniref:transcription repressor NadR n=1 Tax=Carboxydichorda subterranea TaxID=3109565 RepID=UPI0038575EC2
MAAHPSGAVPERGPAARRQALVQILRLAGAPVAGARLAERLGVSRQVIVQDVTVLRASGEPIVATPRGYLWTLPARPEPQYGCRQVVAVSHGPDDIEAELNAVCELGGRVVDVIVEHPVYGELRGLVMTASRADVQEFVANLKDSGAAPLLTLTGGPHLHTIEAPSQARLDTIASRLRELGFLMEG